MSNKLPKNTDLAFNEWMRQFIEEPEKFKQKTREVKDFMAADLENRTPTYGETCVALIEELLDEVNS